MTRMRSSKMRKTISQKVTDSSQTRTQTTLAWTLEQTMTTDGIESWTCSDNAYRSKMQKPRLLVSSGLMVESNVSLEMLSSFLSACFFPA